MILSYYIFIVLNFLSGNEEDNKYVDSPDAATIRYVVSKVNAVREEGCWCGYNYMRPVRPVKWNDILYKSARSHAREMQRYNFFDHFSREGLDIGDRLDKFGYRWQVAGENLGEGQKSFDEVLRDWIDSESHCKMLMNPKVNEMGVAKIGKYWVQHFGKKMPKNAKRINRRSH